MHTLLTLQHLSSTSVAAVSHVHCETSPISPRVWRQFTPFPALALSSHHTNITRRYGRKEPMPPARGAYTGGMRLCTPACSFHRRCCTCDDSSPHTLPVVRQRLVHSHRSTGRGFAVLDLGLFRGAGPHVASEHEHMPPRLQRLPCGQSMWPRQCCHLPPRHWQRHAGTRLPGCIPGPPNISFPFPRFPSPALFAGLVRPSGLHSLSTLARRSNTPFAHPPILTCAPIFFHLICLPSPHLTSHPDASLMMAVHIHTTHCKTNNPCTVLLPPTSILYSPVGLCWTLNYYLHPIAGFQRRSLVLFVGHQLCLCGDRFPYQHAGGANHGRCHGDRWRRLRTAVRVSFTV